MKLTNTILLIIVFSNFPSIIFPQSFRWAKSIEATYVKDICIDALGNVYNVGSFGGTVDFDPSEGVSELTENSEFNSSNFIQKLDGNGEFLWAKKLDDADIYQTTVDNSGNVYSTGRFKGTVDFDPSENEYNLKATGEYDIFVQKLNLAGDFVWAKSMEGVTSSYFSHGDGIDVDELGNVFVTGWFSGYVDFDPNEGETIVLSGASLFVLKLNSIGELSWVKSLETPEDSGWGNSCLGRSLELDGLGNIYLTGNFYGTVDFDPSQQTSILTAIGESDLFVLKLDISGSFIWVKNIGANEENVVGHLIKSDDAGNVHITGHYEGLVDFNPSSSDSYNLNSLWNDTDIFILKLDNFGNFNWVSSLRGPEYLGINYPSLAIDDHGNVYSTGSFRETTDFDPSEETVNLTVVGDTDIFIQKLNSDGELIWVVQMGDIEGYGSNEGHSIAVDDDSNVYTSGRFGGVTDFDINEGINNLTSGNFGNVFIQKIDGDNIMNNHDIHYKNATRLYPNPTRSVVNLELPILTKQSKICIKDAYGVTVLTENIDRIKTQFNISHLPFGIYFFSVNINGEERVTSKIVRY